MSEEEQMAIEAIVCRGNLQRKGVNKRGISAEATDIFEILEEEVDEEEVKMSAENNVPNDRAK